MKNIILTLCCIACGLQQLAAQSLTPGYRGKRFVAEAGVTGCLHQALIPSRSFAGRLEYTVGRRSALAFAYDNTNSRNNLVETSIYDALTGNYLKTKYVATVNIKELGLEYSWGRLNYTLSPYGRFWYVGISSLSYLGKGQNLATTIKSDVLKGYGFKIGAFERTIINRFTYSYGYELAAKSGRNSSTNDPFTEEINERTALDYQLRLFLRVGLAF